MRRVACGLALLVASHASAYAYAHGGDAGGAQLPADVEAVTPQGKKAKAQLAALPVDDASKVLVAEPAKKARLALARAHGAHLARDTDGANLLSRVALAWSEAATATLRAADAEKKAGASETRAGELKEKILRARALLAETEARKLQLAAEVASAEERAKKVGPPRKKDAPKKTPPEKRGTKEKPEPAPPRSAPKDTPQKPAPPSPKGAMPTPPLQAPPPPPKVPAPKEKP